MGTGGSERKGVGQWVPATTSIKTRSLPHVDTDRLLRRQKLLSGIVLAGQIPGGRRGFIDRAKELTGIENELADRGVVVERVTQDQRATATKVSVPSLKDTQRVITTTVDMRDVPGDSIARGKFLQEAGQRFSEEHGSAHRDGDPDFTKDPNFANWKQQGGVTKLHEGWMPRDVFVDTMTRSDDGGYSGEHDPEKTQKVVRDTQAQLEGAFGKGATVTLYRGTADWENPFNERPVVKRDGNRTGDWQHPSGITSWTSNPLNASDFGSGRVVIAAMPIDRILSWDRAGNMAGGGRGDEVLVGSREGVRRAMKGEFPAMKRYEPPARTASGVVELECRTEACAPPPVGVGGSVGRGVTMYRTVNVPAGTSVHDVVKDAGRFWSKGEAMQVAVEFPQHALDKGTQTSPAAWTLPAGAKGKVVKAWRSAGDGKWELIDVGDGIDVDTGDADPSKVYASAGEVEEFYDPGQPRDRRGRWSDGGASGLVDQGLASPRVREVISDMSDPEVSAEYRRASEIKARKWMDERAKAIATSYLEHGVPSPNVVAEFEMLSAAFPPAEGYVRPGSHEAEALRQDIKAILPNAEVAIFGDVHDESVLRIMSGIDNFPPEVKGAVRAVAVGFVENEGHLAAFGPSQHRRFPPSTLWLGPKVVRPSSGHPAVPDAATIVSRVDPEFRHSVVGIHEMGHVVHSMAVTRDRQAGRLGQGIFTQNDPVVPTSVKTTPYGEKNSGERVAETFAAAGAFGFRSLDEDQQTLITNTLRRAGLSKEDMPVLQFGVLDDMDDDERWFIGDDFDVEEL